MVQEEWSFKDFSPKILVLAQVFTWRSKTVCAILVEGIMGTFMCNYFKFGSVVQKEMPFEDLFFECCILALTAILFGGAELFVIFCREHYGEHSCEYILNY